MDVIRDSAPIPHNLGLNSWVGTRFGSGACVSVVFVLTQGTQKVSSLDKESTQVPCI